MLSLGGMSLQGTHRALLCMILNVYRLGSRRACLALAHPGFAHVAALMHFLKSSIADCCVHT